MRTEMIAITAMTAMTIPTIAPVESFFFFDSLKGLSDGENMEEAVKTGTTG